MQYRIGVDINGMDICVGIVDELGNVSAECKTTDHIGYSEQFVIDCAVRNIRQAVSIAKIDKSEIRGVGVLFPGHIRWPDGVTLTSSNLPGFKNYPLRKKMCEILGLPVLADNDANGRTLGEFHFGAGEGCKHMVYLSLGAGIGGGIIIDGKLYRGMEGTAGEFGHMIVDTDGEMLCTCGNRGCLMASVSGLSIPRIANKIAERFAANGTTYSLPSDCTDISEINIKSLKKGCAENNIFTLEITKDFARHTGICLYNIFQIFNPQRVVVGGNLLDICDTFLDTAIEVCYSMTGDMMSEPMDIRKGVLGSRAGMLGAATLFDLA